MSGGAQCLGDDSRRKGPRNNSLRFVNQERLEEEPSKRAPEEDGTDARDSGPS
jgi:hypothetical protein